MLTLSLLQSILNITNQNFATVYAYNLTGQVLFFETVVGSTAIKNVTIIKPLSDKMVRNTVCLLNCVLCSATT